MQQNQMTFQTEPGLTPDEIGAVAFREVQAALPAGQIATVETVTLGRTLEGGVLTHTVSYTVVNA